MAAVGNAVAPFGDAYDVLEDGTVFSYFKSLGPRHGNQSTVNRAAPPRMLAVGVRGDGYVQVCVYGKKRYLHRVVWEAFNGPIPAGLQVRHLDGDKRNNRLDNLAVGTQSDNEFDKYRTGTMACGEKHPHAVMQAWQVVAARELYSELFNLHEIRSVLCVYASEGALHDAIVGKTWKHLPNAQTARGRTAISWRRRLENNRRIHAGGLSNG